MKYTLRLKKSVDFRYVIKKGKFKTGRYINVYIKDCKLDNHNKLGICVSKKNGNSVCRNKLKRWVREAYKNIEPKLVLNLKIVVIFKKNVRVDSTDYKGIYEDLERCLKELKIYE